MPKSHDIALQIFINRTACVAKRYSIKPLLLETLVDEQHYRGACYRAANWIAVGQTTGRGRMDGAHQRHGHAPKRIYVYPLAKNAPGRLRDDKK